MEEEHHHPHPDIQHPVNAAQHWDNVLPPLLDMHPAVTAFLEANASFIITDPRLPGNPIIFASPGFLQLTGYPIDRVLGRNCRFLQGPGTDPAVVAQIREAIDNGNDIAVTLLNYRRDGSTFWNHVLISGVRKEFDGRTSLLYFIGLQQTIRSPSDDGSA